MIEEYDFRSDNQDQTDKTYEIASARATDCGVVTTTAPVRGKD